MSTRNSAPTLPLKYQKNMYPYVENVQNMDQYP